MTGYSTNSGVRKELCFLSFHVHVPCHIVFCTVFNPIMYTYVTGQSTNPEESYERT